MRLDLLVLGLVAANGAVVAAEAVAGNSRLNHAHFEKHRRTARDLTVERELEIEAFEALTLERSVEEVKRSAIEESTATIVERTVNVTSGLNNTKAAFAHYMVRGPAGTIDASSEDIEC